MIERDPRLTCFSKGVLDKHRIRLLEAEADGGSLMPWPALDGCIVLLFASRSGSSFLCKHAQSHFKVDRVGETLNIPQIIRARERLELSSTLDALKSTIEDGSPAGWFMCKAGVPGIISGEEYGLFDRYLDRMSFILLLRRDIIAQAISIFKAQLSGQYHSTQKARREVRENDYDADAIAKLINIIADCCKRLQRYAEATNRPYRTLIYEDYQDGNMQTVDETLLSLGLPQRRLPRMSEAGKLEKLDRGINEKWRHRFSARMSKDIMRLTESHKQMVASSTDRQRVGSERDSRLSGTA